MDSKIHPLSDVLSDKIGKNTYVWQFSVILKGAKIGENCNVNANCFIENDVIIGNNVTIKSGVQIWDGVTLEDNVFVGPNVTFTNDLVPKSKIYPSEISRTLIKKNVSIGANATIVAGHSIGKYAFIGAGSVVTKNIPPFTVWYGNPAIHKGFITKNGVILDLNLIDRKTGKQYSYHEIETTND